MFQKNGRCVGAIDRNDQGQCAKVEEGRKRWQELSQLCFGPAIRNTERMGEQEDEDVKEREEEGLLLELLCRRKGLVVVLR